MAPATRMNSGKVVGLLLGLIEGEVLGNMLGEVEGCLLGGTEGEVKGCVRGLLLGLLFMHRILSSPMKLPPAPVLK